MGLIQVSEICERCDGGGGVRGMPDLGLRCLKCSGTGRMYPTELVERIARIIALQGEAWNPRGKAVAVLDLLEGR